MNVDRALLRNTLIIGLGHKARHGKDSAARILIDTIGPATIRRFAFADALYAYARARYGMQEKDAPLLQRVGLEKRQEDEDYWVRQVYDQIVAFQPAVAVVTDVRFPNEFATIKALGGVCWKVTRRLPDGTPFVDPSRPADHISETALDRAPWDRIIENPDGDPDTFRDRVLCAYFALALCREEWA